MSICGAKRRNGEPCRKPPLRNGTGRCRLHGGLSPQGIASKAWKHGRYSGALPAGVAEKVERLAADSELLSLRAEIALTVARVEEALAEAIDPTALNKLLRATEEAELLLDGQ